MELAGAAEPTLDERSHPGMISARWSEWGTATPFVPGVPRRRRPSGRREGQALRGEEAIRGAACGSDAFFPFPDAVEVCLDAGVAAFVQPGGSMRDADCIAAVDAADASMLTTGVRHFRH